MSKVIKSANGNGSVTRLKGKRRKPYIVRSNASYVIDEDGDLKEIRKIIGYASTKEEAYSMLNNFNKCPYDLDKQNITFKQLYEEWQISYFLGISKSTQQYYKTAYSHCYLIYDRKFKDLKLNDYQRMFDEALDKNGKFLSQDSLKRIKIFLSVLNNYAIKNEIIIRDNSKYIDVKRYKDRDCKTIQRSIFTDKEILKLWQHQEDKISQIALCLIFTGARVQKEFFNIKRKDVDLEERFIHITESKTKNGIRYIPIPDTIFPIISKWYNENISEFLFHTDKGNRIDYRSFLTEWTEYMKGLDISHYIYDTRHTYNSLLANKGISIEDRERLMGQSTGKVNEIYTHRSKERLLEIVNQI